MPHDIQLLPLTDPEDYFAAHTEEMNALTIRAFGGNPIPLTVGTKAHFQAAEAGLLIVAGRRPVGWILYRRIDGDTLWLQGILIDKDYQGQGLGGLAIAEATRGFQSLVAVTRHPATIKLVNKTMRLSCPDLRLADPLHHAQDERIQRLFKMFAPYISADPSGSPFLRECYPHDLYQTDPGAHLPFQLIRESRKNALMVAGIKE